MQDLPTQDDNLQDSGTPKQSPTTQANNFTQTQVMETDKNNENIPKYITDSDDNNTIDDPDRTPETLTYSDNDSTPTEWQAPPTKNLRPTPVLIRPEEMHPFAVDTKEREKAKLGECNWDSDLDLTEDELAYISSHNPQRQAPKQTEDTSRERRKSDGYEADSDPEVWSQTKKRKFRFSIPSL